MWKNRLLYTITFLVTLGFCGLSTYIVLNFGFFDNNINLILIGCEILFAVIVLLIYIKSMIAKEEKVNK